MYQESINRINILKNNFTIIIDDRLDNLFELNLLQKLNINVNEFPYISNNDWKQIIAYMFGEYDEYNSTITLNNLVIDCWDNKYLNDFHITYPCHLNFINNTNSTNIFCFNCKDCNNCTLCIDCKNCNHCTLCIDCVNSLNCDNCKICEDCEYCTNSEVCTYCKNSDDITQLFYCTRCVNCYDCVNCNHCNGCTNCYLSDELIDCTACFVCKHIQHASRVYKSNYCNYCYDCNNCDACDHCEFCNFCIDVNYCKRCNHSKYMVSCNDCNSCTYCYKCNNCTLSSYCIESNTLIYCNILAYVNDAININGNNTYNISNNDINVFDYNDGSRIEVVIIADNILYGNIYNEDNEKIFTGMMSYDNDEIIYLIYGTQYHNNIPIFSGFIGKRFYQLPSVTNQNDNYLFTDQSIEQSVVQSIEQSQQSDEQNVEQSDSVNNIPFAQSIEEEDIQSEQEYIEPQNNYIEHDNISGHVYDYNGNLINYIDLDNGFIQFLNKMLILIN